MGSFLSIFRCCCILSCCRRHGQEVQAINLAASYGHLVHLLDRLFWLTNLVALGHLGKGHLGAGILAYSVLNLSLSFMEGLLGSQDYYSRQLGSQRQQSGLRRWLYISAVFAIAVTIITGLLLFLYSYLIYSYLGIRTHVSARVIADLWFLLPSVLLHGLQIALHKYFYHIAVFFPPVLAGLAALLANIVGNVIALYLFRMGGVGNALSVLVAKAAAVLLFVYFLKKQADINIFTKEFRQVLRRVLRKVRSLVLGIGKSRAATHPMGVARDHEGAREIHEVVFNPSEVEMSTMPRKRLRRQADPAVVVRDESNDEEDARRSREAKDDLEASEMDDAGSDDEQDAGGMDERGENEGELESTPFLLGDDSRAENETGQSVGAPPKSGFFADIVRFAITGFPAAVMLCAYNWPLDFNALIVASMGTVAICSHQLLLFTVHLLVWVFIHPLSAATALRIHHLFHQRRLLDAQYAVRIAFVQCCLVATACAALVYGTSSVLGWVFTSNADIVRRIQSLGVYAAPLVLTNSLQAVSMSIMKVLGYQLDSLTLMLVAQWLVSGGLGVYLAFYAPIIYGLEGMWIGMLTGSGLVAVTLVLQVICLDWHHELKKHALFTREQNAKSKYYDLVLTAVDARSLGGFHLRTYRNVDEEIEELQNLEAIEVVLNDTDP